MIKYKVLVQQEDNSYIEYGTIEGKNKRDLAIKLNNLRKKHNIALDKIKLSCYDIVIEFDKEENL